MTPVLSVMSPVFTILLFSLAIAEVSKSKMMRRVLATVSLIVLGLSLSIATIQNMAHVLSFDQAPTPSQVVPQE